MKRTKQWWARLTQQERSELVFLERSTSYHSAYILDDCSECGNCGTSCLGLGYGLCPLCNQRLQRLLIKANGNYSEMRLAT